MMEVILIGSISRSMNDMGKTVHSMTPKLSGANSCSDSTCLCSE